MTEQLNKEREEALAKWDSRGMERGIDTRRACYVLGWTDRAALSQPVNEDERISKIRDAINEYYDALDNRRHGGLALGRAFDEIQAAMGMHWNQRTIPEGDKQS
jgi:hypothetical protein